MGISITGKHFLKDVCKDEVIEYIHTLNMDPTVDGILTQLPLPDHIEENIIFTEISHPKDVDGIHPLNMAAMARHEEPLFTPCTPKGVMRLLHSVCPDLKGKKATVIGRSNIVGMPIAMLLQKEFATVTLCHIYTKNLREEVCTSDIVISATGSPHLVTGDFVKPGAIVIDVGTKVVKDKNNPNGRLIGDVEYSSVLKKAGYLTPVPGGVGPMTIAMLMDNIVLAWKRNMEVLGGIQNYRTKQEDLNLNP